MLVFRKITSYPTLIVQALVDFFRTCGSGIVASWIRGTRLCELPFSLQGTFV